MDGSKSTGDSKRYTCKYCSRLLFTDADIIDHTSDSKKFKRKGGPSSFCATIYVNQLEWMGDLPENEGKFNCPNEKCGKKLGHYVWSGAQCSCGKWVVPALGFPHARVDEKKATSATPAVKIVFPQMVTPGSTVTKPSATTETGKLMSETSETSTITSTEAVTKTE
eukprot:CAMPEP_0115019640 /NCGR_PEP_ID=MMETSP0216-20121206/29582_1 /TAXON_ID=223996 /ORGANISM="Protocruzia adherens, Strain Boccale" /LENGTH=165 /DNA_ID=CAMNT_0002391185 /DNA_START=42 /DNA_END=542 /DNA_ORIENTATION=+